MYRSMYSSPRHWMKVSGQFHAPAALPPEERAPSTHWIGNWVGPRAGLDDVERWRGEKSCPDRHSNSRPLGRPARNQSLYRQRHSGFPYSGGARFESRLGDRVFCLGFFVVFLSPPGQMGGKYFDLAMMISSKFIIHHLLTPYSLHTDIAVKQTH
jgi:hypothetical protein